MAMFAQPVRMSRLTTLVGLNPRGMYYMAFLPGKKPPEPEPVILSYADHVAAMKRDTTAASTDKAKQSKV